MANFVRLPAYFLQRRGSVRICVRFHLCAKPTFSTLLPQQESARRRKSKDVPVAPSASTRVQSLRLVAFKLSRFIGSKRSCGLMLLLKLSIPRSKHTLQLSLNSEARPGNSRQVKRSLGGSRAKLCLSFQTVSGDRLL